MTIEIIGPTARLVVASADPRGAARIRYAFSAYAALHGIRVVRAGPADVTVAYGEVTGPAGDRWTTGGEVAAAVRARWAAAGAFDEVEEVTEAMES